MFCFIFVECVPGYTALTRTPGSFAQVFEAFLFQDYHYLFVFLYFLWSRAIPNISVVSRVDPAHNTTNLNCYIIRHKVCKAVVSIFGAVLRFSSILDLEPPRHLLVFLHNDLLTLTQGLQLFIGPKLSFFMQINIVTEKTMYSHHLLEEYSNPLIHINR